jgi:hypothetical protein
MSEEIIYKKVGSKYVPARYFNTDWDRSFPEGATIIIKQGNSELRQYKIDPAFAPMIAAGRYAYEGMLEGLRNAAEARPGNKTITQEEADAWENLKKIMGNDRFYIQYPSLHDIADGGIKALEVEAEKMMTHSAVRDAYEQFLMVWKLCKENEK